MSTGAFFWNSSGFSYSGSRTTEYMYTEQRFPREQNSPYSHKPTTFPKNVVPLILGTNEQENLLQWNLDLTKCQGTREIGL